MLDSEQPHIHSFQNLVDTLDKSQMTIPPNCIRATKSLDCRWNARLRIKGFFNHPSQRIVTFGYSSEAARDEYPYSSDGAIEHILFRSQNCTVFVVFRTTDRGDRIYYLPKEILYDVFEGYEREMPNVVLFEEHCTQITSFENLVNTLTEFQMTIPRNCIWATIEPCYRWNARLRINGFFDHPSQRMVTIGYSSGVAREHILFRSQNCTVFLVFRTADRGDRIYYLRKEMLYLSLIHI